MEARVEGQQVLIWERMLMPISPNSYICTGPISVQTTGYFKAPVSSALGPEGLMAQKSKAKTAEMRRISRKNFLSPFA